jgi:tetratricopeptide (TPR) repeat protein
MVSSDRPARRRWVWLLAAGVLLLAGAYLAALGLAAWQERLARHELAEDHLDEARRHVERALIVPPTWRSTTLLAARIARLRGAWAEAEHYLDRCGPRNEMAEPVQLEWLLLRCGRGEVDGLAPDLLRLVDQDHAESAAVLEALAGVYMRQTRYLDALGCLDRWIERDPDCLRALYWRGWVSNQLDHRAQAIGDYEHLLELRPDRSTVRRHLAEILLDSSRHADALPHLERLHEELPDDPDVLVGLARCRVVQSRNDDARELLDAALAANPQHFDALVQRGKLELNNRNAAGAEKFLRQALARSPLDPEARFALYQALQMQPNRQPEAQRELLRWKRDRRARDRLTQLLRTELPRSPNDANLAREAGELLLQQGEDRRGVFWLERALALDPRHAASHRALIGYYERTGNKARAEEHRQRLAAISQQPKSK